MIKNDSEKIKLKLPFPQMKHYVWVLAGVWTIVIAGSLIWHSFHTKQETLEVAQTQARVAYEKDIIYRRWNAGHGGVYVPVTKETQPNPYLSDVPERDITTPSGKALTLMNPAYMTRQAHELEKQKLGVRGHITSLNPIRPENAPDPWETEALRAFGRGVPEINSVEEIQSKKYMRLMRPLITEKGCLKCHAKQGYHEGDIRGGISVSIPMDPFLAFERKHILTFALIYGLLWIVGLSGIGLGTQRLMRTERERRRAEEALQKAHGELERKVEERTADLSKANIFLEQEISERKLAEESLRASEVQFRAMFEVASIGIAQADIRTGQWLRVNQKMCEITGYSAEEMLQMRVPEITHPEDRQRDWDAFQRVVRGESPDYRMEKRYIRKDGLIVWVNVNMTVIRDADEPMRTMATIEDITERKRAEKELKHNESRMITLLELNKMTNATLQDITSFALEDAIRLTESTIGYLAFLNEDETVMTMYAWYRTAMEECQISDKPIIYPVETTGLWGEAVRQRRPITTNDYQAPNPWKKSYPEGHVHVTRHMNIPVFDGERIVLVAGVGNKPTDYNESDVNQLTLLMEGMWRIIQRQRAETEIKQLNAELEQRVIERTAQLEAANEELEAFAYSVSHDLRAPLRAIDGFSRFVLEDYAEKLDDEGKRLLNIIRTNTQKMDELITDLLGLSRVSRTEMKLSRIDITTLVNSIYHELASPEVQQKFIFSVEPLPDAFGDPTLIRQVWFNLISNAIKYTLPKEERRIEIGSRAEGGMNVYYIKDTGVGFNPDYTHKLFGLFQRLHKAEEFEGTGVGLSIVKRIILRHGGKVWAEGKLNEGATFCFSMPIKEA
ncbi:MAG: PAS domain S-box protein [Thermodesulfovibrionales bacterium]